MGALLFKFLPLAIAAGIVAGNHEDLEKMLRAILQETQYVTTAADMRTITNMLDLQYMRTGRYPSRQGFEGWMRASFRAGPKRNMLEDNWGHLFVYRPGPARKSFELVSAGADGTLGTEDDLQSQGP